MPLTHKDREHVPARIGVLNGHTDKVFRLQVDAAGYGQIALEKVFFKQNLVVAPPLAENDRINIMLSLAVRLPDEAKDIVELQLARTENPDNLRRLRFIAPSLSADPAVRDAFFASLAEEANRTTESWVLEALANLHHPVRSQVSERYILPSLELLQEIQVTGDIFFPKRWLDATLSSYNSTYAVTTVRTFLEERPDYNEQLRMKILQAADMLFRANAIVASQEPQ